MSPLATDRELVTAMRGGDEAAFDRFFREYAPRLYRFVLPRLGGAVQDTEEVCQEVLGRAMRQIGTWRGEASLLTWLFQIARNEITDHWRRSARRDSVEVFAEDDPAIAAALESFQDDASHQPERQTARADLLRLVQVALDRLPANYGDALEWKYVDGLSVVEIGERLRLNPVATQSLLARARNSFREAFVVLTGRPSEEALFFALEDGTP
jgi:RNA polymerase sigma-70 factor, ECF subfamily